MIRVIFIISDDIFVKDSLELNLFFLRIIKEHAIFTIAGLPEINQDLIQEAKKEQKNAYDLLSRALELARGVVSIKNQHVTNNTLAAEQMTSALTGIPINTDITSAELLMKGKSAKMMVDSSLVTSVESLNKRAMTLTKNAIRFSTKIIEQVEKCKVFSFNYPTMIKHIREESVMYYDLLTKLQNRQDITYVEEELNLEAFWNHIMEEHAQFIQGFLDPSEKALIEIAKRFEEQYDKLTTRCYHAIKNIIQLPAVTSSSLILSKEFLTFKKTATEGILSCKIKSVINPLLADHVVREVNHYLDILEKIKT